MKAFFIDGSEEECVAFCRRFGIELSTEPQQQQQQQQQQEDGVRVPHVVPGTRKRPHDRAAPVFGQRRWSASEWRAAKEFYMDAKNHYVTGDVIGSKLDRFAASLGRTSMAVSVRFIEKRLNRRLVRGTKRRAGFRGVATVVKKEKGREQVLGHRKGVPLSPEHKRRISEGMRKRKRKDVFQQMTTVNRKLLREALLDVAESGRSLDFRQGQYLFGIGSPVEWSVFTLEFGLHAGELARALGLSGSFTLDISDGGAGKIGYRK